MWETPYNCENKILYFEDDKHWNKLPREVEDIKNALGCLPVQSSLGKLF